MYHILCNCVQAVDQLVAANFSLPGVTREDLTGLQYIVNESNPNNLWNNLQLVHDGAQVGLCEMSGGEDVTV